jgi:hypothetical protein
MTKHPQSSETGQEPSAHALPHFAVSPELLLRLSVM